MSGAVGRPSAGCAGGAGDGNGTSWIDGELAGCALGDKRLCDRLRRLLHQLEGAMGAPLPLACQDWANTKAAYRFLSSGRFGEDAILAGHFQATASRFAATGGPILASRTRPGSATGGPNPRPSVRSAGHRPGGTATATCARTPNAGC